VKKRARKIDQLEKAALRALPQGPRLPYYCYRSIGRCVVSDDFDKLPKRAPGEEGWLYSNKPEFMRRAAAWGLKGAWRAVALLELLRWGRQFRDDTKNGCGTQIATEGLAELLDISRGYLDELLEKLRRRKWIHSRSQTVRYSAVVKAMIDQRVEGAWTFKGPNGEDLPFRRFFRKAPPKQRSFHWFMRKVSTVYLTARGARRMGGAVYLAGKGSAWVPARARTQLFEALKSTARKVKARIATALKKPPAPYEVGFVSTITIPGGPATSGAASQGPAPPEGVVRTPLGSLIRQFGLKILTRDATPARQLRP
jgi:hypothetical protein